MRSNGSRVLSGFAFVAIATLAGLLTWLCVGWFGGQSLPTAMMAVLLVEVFLASFGVIAMLLAERMATTMLKFEEHASTPPRTTPPPPPVWVRIHSSPAKTGPAEPPAGTGDRSRVHGEDGRPSTGLTGKK